MKKNTRAGHRPYKNTGQGPQEGLQRENNNLKERNFRLENIFFSSNIVQQDSLGTKVTQKTTEISTISPLLMDTSKEYDRSLDGSL